MAEQEKIVAKVRVKGTFVIRGGPDNEIIKLIPFHSVELKGSQEQEPQKQCQQ